MQASKDIDFIIVGFSRPDAVCFRSPAANHNSDHKLSDQQLCFVVLEPSHRTPPFLFFTVSPRGCRSACHRSGPSRRCRQPCPCRNRSADHRSRLPIPAVCPQRSQPPHIGISPIARDWALAHRTALAPAGTRAPTSERRKPAPRLRRGDHRHPYPDRADHPACAPDAPWRCR
jgi:hypothetical protein